MLKIKRDKDGNHTVDGKPFDPIPCAELFRKKTLTFAVRMQEPFSVETLEGTAEGKVGDWLVIGVTGEMYPCDAEVFDKSYEPA